MVRSLLLRRPISVKPSQRRRTVGTTLRVILNAGRVLFTPLRNLCKPTIAVTLFKRYPLSNVAILVLRQFLIASSQEFRDWVPCQYFICIRLVTNRTPVQN